VGKNLAAGNGNQKGANVYLKRSKRSKEGGGLKGATGKSCRTKGEGVSHLGKLQNRGTPQGSREKIGEG